VIREKRFNIHAQVEIIDLELVKRVIERRVRLVVAHVPLGQHSHDEQLGARDPRVGDGLADCLLVTVHPSGVKGATAVLEEKRDGVVRVGG
jgi:hypothetical protein